MHLQISRAVLRLPLFYTVPQICVIILLLWHIDGKIEWECVCACACVCKWENIKWQWILWIWADNRAVFHMMTSPLNRTLVLNFAFDWIATGIENYLHRYFEWGLQKCEQNWETSQRSLVPKIEAHKSNIENAYLM